MRIVFFGLTISSSWGNGHASTYRSLLRGLTANGHETVFYERNAEWYVSNRDLPAADFVAIRPYDDWDAFRPEARRAAREADAVVVGSYFADAVPLLDEILGRTPGPVAFYDIDTPITLAALARGACRYLRSDQIPALDLYLSFTGGPALDLIERQWGAQAARPLYCSCAADDYPFVPPRRRSPRWDLSYMGTYAPDRQARFRRLLLEPARRAPERQFCVAGPLFPGVRRWPANVRNIFHLSPREHADFYRASQWTLNLTRQAMVEWGYSPSVRLFEAAACGVPLLSDNWPGLEAFFRPGEEIRVVHGAGEVVRCLAETPPADLNAQSEAAYARFLGQHTHRQRARELETYLNSVASRQPAQPESAVWKSSQNDAWPAGSTIGAEDG